MRSLLALAPVGALLLLAPGVAPAQPPGGGMFRANPAMLLGQESIRKDLKLNDEQTKKVEELTTRTREKMQDIFSLEGDERRTKMEELSKETEKSVNEILKADQVKRLKQISYQLQGPSALMSADIAKALAITDEQKKEIQQINQDLGEKMRDLFQGGFNEEARKKMQEARKEASEKAEKVLTDEQKKKWKDLQGEPFKGELRFGRPGGG